MSTTPPSTSSPSPSVSATPSSTSSPLPSVSTTPLSTLSPTPMGYQSSISKTNIFVVDKSNATLSVEKTKDFIDKTTPPGTIIMWYGTPSSVPPGWEICDGGSATISGVPMQKPNFKGRFPLGANSPSYSLLSTGGEKSVLLNESQMPSHNHFLGYSAQSYSNCGTSCGVGGIIVRPDVASSSYSSRNTANTSRTYTSGDPAQFIFATPPSIGFSIKTKSDANLAHENMPPYLTLFFIIRVDM